MKLAVAVANEILGGIVYLLAVIASPIAYIGGILVYMVMVILAVIVSPYYGWRYPPKFMNKWLARAMLVAPAPAALLVVSPEQVQPMASVVGLVILGACSLAVAIATPGIVRDLLSDHTRSEKGKMNA